MPYTLRKRPLHNTYWVVNKETGRKLSKEALPLKKAEAQMRAVYASEAGYKLNKK